MYIAITFQAIEGFFPRLTILLFLPLLYQSFFAKAAAEFRERITRYRSTMEEIGKQLSTIDNRNDHSPELISNVILNQHSTFMSLASNVASLHSEIDQLKRDYTNWYQQQYRSVQDPFAMSLLTSTL